MEPKAAVSVLDPVDASTRPGFRLASALPHILLVVALVLIGALGWYWLRPTPAPFSASQAGLSGRTWVMPSSDLVAFMHRHGYEAHEPPVPGTVVVGRVRWAPRPTGSDASFTIMLGDKRVRAGSIYETFGPSNSSVTLGGGSMWNGTLNKSPWLAGGRVFLTDQGWTSNSTFASVPVSAAGPMWFVAYVVVNDPSNPDGYSQPVAHPSPVLVVALSTGDHVWWAHRLP